MATINLHGDLKDFGSSFNLKVSSVAEAIRALDANCPGFLARVVKPGHSYRVVVNGNTTSESLIPAPIHRDSVVDIVPVISGGKSEIGMIIAGVVLIALAVPSGGGS